MGRVLVRRLVPFACACVMALLMSVTNAGGQGKSSDAQSQAEPPSWTGCFYEALGKRPKGLEDFENFFVNNHPGKPLMGGIITKSSSLVFTFAKVEVTGEHLIFTTVARRGTKYSFEGRLLKGAGGADNDVERRPVAEGTLKRFRRGKQVAEGKVRLSCNSGGEGQ